METATRVTPRNCGVKLDLDDNALGFFRDSTDAIAEPAVLQARMRQDGYLFLPGLLGRDRVLAARHEVCRRLADAGVLDPTAPIDDGILLGPDVRGFMPELLAKDNAPLLRVVYDGPMMAFWQAFLGGEVRHFDFTWFRSIPPGEGTPSHCDAVYMGRGTQNLYTAWTPFGDIDTEVGGLMILEGSNNHQRLVETYCNTDVDSFCANRDGPAGLDGWHKTGGWLGRDANRIRRSLGGRWLTCPQFHAGDVLVFSINTVHAGLDNQSANRIRLSCDTRYQLASEPADERWIGPNPIGHGPAGKRGKIC